MEKVFGYIDEKFDQFVGELIDICPSCPKNYPNLCCLAVLRNNWIPKKFNAFEI